MGLKCSTRASASLGLNSPQRMDATSAEISALVRPGGQAAGGKVLMWWLPHCDSQHCDWDTHSQNPDSGAASARPFGCHAAIGTSCKLRCAVAQPGVQQCSALPVGNSTRSTRPEGHLHAVAGMLPTCCKHVEGEKVCALRPVWVIKHQALCCVSLATLDLNGNASTLCRDTVRFCNE
jgi:hypothetical protein